MASPRRKRMRLAGFDYSSAGAYFVTLVTKSREHLFGEIVNEEMVLSDFGRIVSEEWERSAVIRKEIELGEFVIMPNHFHGIVHIYDDNKGFVPSKGDRGLQPSDVGAYGHFGRGDRPVAPTDVHGPSPKSLGSMIGGFKASVTTRINKIRQTPGISVWQRNFYDHIIGIDREYDQIEEYILDNPYKWAWDEENNPIL